jgi:hypothetical protein
MCHESVLTDAKVRYKLRNKSLTPNTRTTAISIAAASFDPGEKRLPTPGLVRSSQKVNSSKSALDTSLGGESSIAQRMSKIDIVRYLREDLAGRRTPHECVSYASTGRVGEKEG